MAIDRSGFWFSNPNGMGGTFGTARPGYGDFSAVNQANANAWAGVTAKYPGLYGGSLYAPAGAGAAWGSGFSPAPTSTATGGGGAPGAAGLPLLQTAKSPAGNAALASALNNITSLSNSPNQAIFSTVKDPAQAARIGAQGAQLDTVNATADKTLADFTTNYLASDPQAKSYMTQETGAMGNWYAPASDPNSIQGSLNKLAQQRQLAVAGSVQRALGAAQRQGNINRMGLGGDSSYITQQFGDTAAGLLSQEAVNQADLARQNYLTVAQGQNALAGQRAGLLNSYLSRNLAPIQAGQQLTSSQLGNLGSLGAVGNANTLYQTPEQLQAARLGLLGQYAGNLNAMNIFGVGGQFPNQTYPPMPRSGMPQQPQGPQYGPGPGGNGTVLQNPQYSPNPNSNGGLPGPNIDPVTRQAYYQAMGVYPEQDPNVDQQFLAYLQAATQAATGNGMVQHTFGGDPNVFPPGTSFVDPNTGYDSSGGDFSNLG